MSKTNIEWTGHTWNPLSGCTKVSEGCKNCYAEKMAHRLQAMGAKGYENGFAVTLHYDKLDEPLKRKKPTMYFVCSMGDLFHEDVPFEFIDKVWAVMAAASHHTFQILTKRPDRMEEYLRMQKFSPNHLGIAIARIAGANERIRDFSQPLENVWLGVTAENQEQADKRIPILLDTPAEVRFISIEPMIGAINLAKLEKDMSDGTRYGYKMNGLTGVGYEYIPDSSHEWKWAKLDWVIVGGETGANARPMHPDWVRSIQKQCKAANVPFFFKQWGEWTSEGAHPAGKWEMIGRCGKRLDEVKSSADLCWVAYTAKVGKKRAGHLLDGVEYRQMPETEA